jgi:hypothetical protein
LTDFSDWGYKTSVTITGSTDGALTNYPVPITIPYQSFMRSDFGDIRFALPDGTELKYCIDNLVEGDHCDLLIMFSSLPASPGTVTIVVYAGNPAVTTTSNPDAVYEFQDDFSGTSLDTTKWNITGSPTISVANSELTISKIPSATWSFHGITSNYQFGNNDGTKKIIVKFKRNNVVDQGAGSIASRFWNIGKIDSIIQQQTTVFKIQCDNRNNSGNFTTTQFVTAFTTGQYYTLTLSQKNGTLTATINTETKTQSTNVHTNAAPVALGLEEWQTYSTAQDLIIDYIKIIQTTLNPPSAGSFGTWTENSLIISVPPAEGTLKATTPTIVLGGAMVVSVPPAGGILTANAPTLHAIISSPSAKGTLMAIPPIVAFLMEVKAGVTYNPDAINDLKEDGIPCNISFNVTIGGQQYE